jgi:hypothetical protein
MATADMIAETEAAHIFALNEKGDLVFKQNSLDSETISNLFGPIARTFTKRSETSLTGHIDGLSSEEGFI